MVLERDAGCLCLATLGFHLLCITSNALKFVLGIICKNIRNQRSLLELKCYFSVQSFCYKYEEHQWKILNGYRMCPETPFKE